MALILTRHNLDSRDVLSGQIADSITINGGSNQAIPAGLYRIYANADHLVKFGAANVTNPIGGEPWPSGTLEVRYVGQNAGVAVKTGL